MYIPKAFREDDSTTIHTFMREYSFATLITQHEGLPFATHLPFILDAERGPNGLIRPADEIYNAKLSISFTSQLRGRLYLPQTVPERPLVASFVSSCFFFMPNMGLTLSISSAGLIGLYAVLLLLSRSC
jgi:hypothetical protein